MVYLELHILCNDEEQCPGDTDTSALEPKPKGANWLEEIKASERLRWEVEHKEKLLENVPKAGSKVHPEKDLPPILVKWCVFQDIKNKIKRERIWNYDSIYLKQEVFTFKLTNILKVVTGMLHKWKITPITIVFTNLVITYLFFGRLKIYKKRIIIEILELVQLFYRKETNLSIFKQELQKIKELSKNSVKQVRKFLA